MRVYLGTTEVAGYYEALTRILNERGVDAHFFTYGQHPFYDRDTSHYSESERHLNELIISSKNKVKIFFYKLKYFFTEVSSYDAFIFGFTQTVLPFGLDLVILKFMGKRVITNIGHGSEARPPVVNGAFKELGTLAILIETLKRRIKVKINFRFAHFVVGQPLSSSNFVGRNHKMVNWFRVGVPTQCAISAYTGNDERRFEIVHIPSDRATKGTSDILRATSLHGFKIEVFEGLSHDEVIRILKSSKILVDQLYSDTPLPTMATEAIRSGCLPLVFGNDLGRIRIGDRSPIEQEEGLIEALKLYTGNEKERLKRVEILNNFLNESWSNDRIFSVYKEMLFGDSLDDKYYFSTTEYVGINPIGLSICEVNRRLSVIPRFLRSFLLGDNASI